jgi:nicotinamidase-related amidase
MAKTALLVVDMQNVFTEMTHVCLPNILKLSEFFRGRQMTQIFTQHGHSQDELLGRVKNQLVRKWGAAGSIAIGSESWRLMPDIDQAWKAAGGERTPIINKNTYDAFLNTNLEGVLKEKNIERVIVCGVMTDCCCDTTGRSAFNRGFETWLVNDATGSANSVQHERGLEAFGFAFGDVINTDEVLHRMSG